MTEQKHPETISDDDLDAVQGAGVKPSGALKGSSHDRASFELKKKPDADGVIHAETTGADI